MSEEIKRIKVLSDLIVRQIAAGEVIERPASAVRELIDNSLDAGATRIDLSIKKGGVDFLQISDNGSGIHKDDLPLCCTSHATSKIEQSNDLFSIVSMGFRGEALASLSAVARVSIVSSTDSKEAYKIVVDATGISDIEPSTRKKGSTITVENMFHNVPARKKFLSGTGTEERLARSVFLKKAAAFPSVAFSLSSEKTTSQHLPVEDAFQRCIRVCSKSDPAYFLWQDEVFDDDISLKCALGLPELAQRTRKNIHIYVNNRPIKDFTITQAVEFAYRNVLHGGRYPQAVLMLTIPPSKLDVNIHPAKTEIKLLEIDRVRKLIIATIDKKLKTLSSATPDLSVENLVTDAQDSIFSSEDTENIETTGAAPVQEEKKMSSYSLPPPSAFPPAAQGLGKYREKTNAFTEKNTQPFPPRSSRNPFAERPPVEMSDETLGTMQEHARIKKHGYIYIATVFETYLVFEKEKKLVFLDFHAAHERIIFDLLKNSTEQLRLLIPVPLHVNTTEGGRKALIEGYKQCNIELVEKDAELLLSSIPAKCPLSGGIIAQIIEESSGAETINAELFARKACRRAAKAGDLVDVQGAFELLRKVMDLAEPRCPHGRPLWLTLDKKQLDSLIGRV